VINSKQNSTFSVNYYTVTHIISLISW